MQPVSHDLTVTRGDDAVLVVRLSARTGDSITPLDPAGSTFDFRVIGAGALQRSTQDGSLLVDTQDGTSLVVKFSPRETRRFSELGSTYALVRTTQARGVRTYLTGLLRGQTIPAAGQGDASLGLIVSDKETVVSLIVDQSSAAIDVALTLAAARAYTDQALASALGNDLNFAATVAEALSTKATPADIEHAIDAEAFQRGQADEAQTNARMVADIALDTRLVILRAILDAKSRLRDSLRYPWAIIGRDGRLGAWLTRSGTFFAGNFSTVREVRARDRSRYVDTWRDALGRVSLGVLPSGAVEVSDLVMPGRARRARDVAPYPWSIRDRMGRVALGLLPSGGIQITSLWLTATPRRLRDAARYLWSIRDRTGRVSLGLLPSGAVEMSDLVMLPRFRRSRDVARYLFALRDRSGRLALGVLPSGAVEIPTLSILPSAKRIRDARAYVGTLLRAPNHRTLLAWTADGVDVALSPAGARHVTQSLMASPAAMRGLHSLAGPVLQTPRHTFASVQESDGRVSLVQQMRQGGSTYAVACSAQPLRLLLTAGQSNSGAGSAEGPFASAPIKTALFPYHVLQLLYAEFYGDGAVLGSYTDAGMAPAADQSYGQSPRNALLWAMEQRGRDAGLPSPGYVGATSWRGGYPIDNFLPGAVVAGKPNGLIYNNCTAIIDSMLAEASRLGRSAEVDVYWIQGENASTGYLANLTTLFNALSTYILTKNPVQRAPLFLVAQTNSSDDIDLSNGNDLDQWTASRTRADTILVTPMYPFRLHAEDPGIPGASGAIHVSNIGRLEQGEVAAIAYQTRLSTGMWKPLGPKLPQPTRSGATISIPCDVPAGAMQWDTDRVPLPAYGYRGIQAAKASDGTALTVTNVVLGAGVMTVTLAADPGGPVIVKAGLGQDTVIDLWAGPRLPIYSEEPSLSVYFRMGLATWRKPRHYMVKFSVTTNS